MTPIHTYPEPRRAPSTITALVLLFALLATACASQNPVATEYGVVPEPPLPVGQPVVGLDPSIGIANLNGSVVVELEAGQLTFTRSEASRQPGRMVGAEQDLRAVSAHGTMAALFTRLEDSSLITVIDQDPLIDNLTFTLDGVIEPEAFSTDGRLLYVIDHQISATPGAYRVRPLNLETGQLETILGRTKFPLRQDMNGVGRQQVWSPDGSRLNTLYIRQTHHHHGSDNPDDDGTAQPTPGEPGTDGFIHILDLDDEWAHCLDLPSVFGGGELSTTALAISPDGTTLAIADATAGEIAFASAEDLMVTRTVPMPDFKVGDDLHLGLSNNALILGSGDSAQWYNSTTMNLLGQPITLPADLIGFTPNGNSTLAWTESGVPLTLTP